MSFLPTLKGCYSQEGQIKDRGRLEKSSIVVRLKAGSSSFGSTIMLPGGELQKRSRNAELIAPMIEHPRDLIARR